jgi:tetratricopeptide (TPR) repeat protein
MIGLALFAILSSLQVGHWQNAETLFRQAVAVTRDNALAHNNLGAALSRQGRHGEALVPLAQSLRIRPDYVEALFNTGVALAGQGRYAESLEFYERVLKLQPRFAQAHNNMAILYARMGNLDQAQIHFREAIRLQPGYRTPSEISGLRKRKEFGFKRIRRY